MSYSGDKRNRAITVSVLAFIPEGTSTGSYVSETRRQQLTQRARDR